MSRNFIFCVLFSLSAIFNSCKKTNDQAGNWIKLSNFSGAGRSEAVTFVIGDFAYLTNGIDINFNRYNDLWQFDPVKGIWIQEANFPGNSRNSAIGMTIGNQGYLGTGYDGTNLLKDFWQYDPSTNSWTRKADFAGTARYDAVAFSIKNYGYVATGFDTSSLKDCWQYDPSLDLWKQRADLKGNPRLDAVTFVYNNQAYIVTGRNNASLVYDFWKFDPSQPDSSAWIQLRDIDDRNASSYDHDYTTILRTNAVAFVILNTKSGDKAYITTGSYDFNTLYKLTWSYDFAKDLWNEVTPFEGVAREGAVGFSVQNRGFVGTGRNANSTFMDIEEYHPN